MSQRLFKEKAAKRLMIYIGESDQWRGKPLYAALLETLKARGMAGATVLRGVAGFGAHSAIHTSAILRLSLDLPLVVHVIDAPEKIQSALEVVAPMVREGLITLEDVEIVKYAHRYLHPLPADKRVADAMTREVIALREDMSVSQAWEIMLANLLKALPVLNARGEVVGILTDEDLLDRAGLEQRLSVAERLDENLLQSELTALKSSPLKVADVMTSPAVTVLENDSLGVAASMMAARGIKRLPVLDHNGKLVGALSRVDILRQVAGEEAKRRAAQAPAGAAKTLGAIMQPEVPVAPQDAEVGELIARFLEFGTRRLIVVDDEGRPLGLVSDADVVTRVQPAARRGALNALRGVKNVLHEKNTARELMSDGALTAPPDTTLAEAAQLMLSQKRKWLAVTDSQGKAIGLVDRQILLRALAG